MPLSPIVPAGSPVRVHKLRPDGSERFAYEGAVVRSCAAGLALRALFPFEDLALDFTTLRHGDVFVEFYRWDRCFVVAQVSAPDGALKGWYCDVTVPPTLEAGTDGAHVTYVDLALDLWRGANGTTVLLDEEEFASRRALGEFSEAQLRDAEQGWTELQALDRANMLPRWPA